MDANVSEDYRRGWIECAEAIRNGASEASTHAVADFGSLRDRLEAARRDARARLAKAGDDPHRLRTVADFYEATLDLFLLQVERERDFHAKRVLHAFRDRVIGYAS